MEYPGPPEPAGSLVKGDWAEKGSIYLGNGDPTRTQYAAIREVAGSPPARLKPHLTMHGPRDLPFLPLTWKTL